MKLVDKQSFFRFTTQFVLQSFLRLSSFLRVTILYAKANSAIFNELTCSATLLDYVRATTANFPLMGEFRSRNSDMSG